MICIACFLRSIVDSIVTTCYVETIGKYCVPTRRYVVQVTTTPKRVTT